MTALPLPGTITPKREDAGVVAGARYDSIEQWGDIGAHYKRGLPAALQYVARINAYYEATGDESILTNDIFYLKIDNIGYIVHATELDVLSAAS